MSELHRYPGVKPFETDQKGLFFGRDEDIQDLADLVGLEKLVVLFGKSGYGKSSLIHAGLIPLLTDESLEPEDSVLPILIRLRSHSSDESSPLDKVRAALVKQLPDVIAPALFTSVWKDSKESESLWYTFRQRMDAKSPRILLIFDQFEEFFTYPSDQQTRFRQELSELLFTEIPQVLRKNWRNHARELRRFLSQEMEIKVLFSIRHDKLFLMNGLKTEFPTILQKRYELRGLTMEQAKDAILKPAALEGEQYKASPFGYEEDALQLLLAELSKSQRSDPYAAGQAKRIESFLLQICCEYIESHAIETDDRLIELHDLPDFNNIYEAYYNGKIEELPAEIQTGAKRLMEEGLLFYDEQSGEARRMSVDRDQLLTDFRADGIEANLLETLKNKFLIREERNSVGGYSYEISHDTLLAPIIEAREIRMKEEERKALQKRNWRLVLGSVIALGISVGAIAFGLWANNQQREAEMQKEKADTLAQILESERSELASKLTAIYLENGASALAGDFFSEAITSFESALKYDSTNTQAINGIEEAERGIKAAEENATLLETFERRVRRGDRYLLQNKDLLAFEAYQKALIVKNEISLSQSQMQLVQSKIQLIRNRLEAKFRNLISQGDIFMNAGANDLASQRYQEALRIQQALGLQDDNKLQEKLNGL